MQLVTSSGKSLSAAGADIVEVGAVTESRYSKCGTVRRNGAVFGFDPDKFFVALTKAFPVIEGGQGTASARIRELVTARTVRVVGADCADVQGISALHPQSPLPADRRGPTLSGGEQAFALDERNDQFEERAQLFRSPSDRVSDRRRTQLGFATFMPATFERRQACVN